MRANPESSAHDALCTKHDVAHYSGCMVGTGVGDAFGAPIEFMKLKKIVREYGPGGLTDLVVDKKRGTISFTDDTQQAMFTADGLIKSSLRKGSIWSGPDLETMFASYRDWYKVCALAESADTGWLSELPGLYGTRGGGKTSHAVLSGDVMGSLANPLNDSAGSGGVMRSAPIGLMYYASPERAFDIAVECAALTHGNPGGYLPAGLYAAVIAYIIQGKGVAEAADAALAHLRKRADGAGMEKMLVDAIALAANDGIDAREAIKFIGRGWRGDEALSIALYCAIRHPCDYLSCIIEATNHDGDSDTVGSIAGGIVGTYLGLDGIPISFVNRLPMAAELVTLAEDVFNAPADIADAGRRYPQRKM